MVIASLPHGRTASQLRHIAHILRESNQIRGKTDIRPSH